MIVFEKLKFLSILRFIFNLNRFKLKQINQIYYINTSKFILLLNKIIFKLIKIQIVKLNFKMIDIRADDNEIIRLKIPRKILFDLEKEYENLYNYKLINFNEKLKFFFKETIFSENYMNKKSMFRTIYIFWVLKRFKYISNTDRLFFFISSRSTNNVYETYSKKIGIELIKEYNIFNIIFLKSQIIKTFFKLSFFKLRKLLILNKKIDDKHPDIYRIYCEGNYQPNLEKNGNKSDFFWLFDSKIKNENVVYNTLTDKDYYILKKNGFNVSFNFSFKYLKWEKFCSFISIIQNFFNINSDSNLFLTQTLNYEKQYNFWLNYFNNYKVKIILNWHKYNSNYVPAVDALSSLNGISVFYQMNFESHSGFDCRLKSDIYLCNNKFSSDLSKINKSIHKYQLITGYQTNQINAEMQNQANKVRNNLIRNGAKKIICILDENSLDDERWHTGHNLQEENYKYLLLELFKNKNLGLIFKPKHYATLKERIGDTFLLLQDAINTGRCFIYDELNSNIVKTTKATPLLAALSSDLVVHSHLCAGTAAVETALANIPTVMIDRECDNQSIFYEIMDNNIILKDWHTAVDSINENFLSNKINLNFGNWSEYLEVFDPFRDNMGSKRIGNVLSDLLINTNNQISKDNILEIIADNYSKKWGKDKVVY